MVISIKSFSCALVLAASSSCARPEAWAERAYSASLYGASAGSGQPAPSRDVLERTAEIVRKRLASKGSPRPRADVHVAGNELRVSLYEPITPDQLAELDRWVSSPGTFELCLVASEVDASPDRSLAEEQVRAWAWRQKNPDLDLSSFNDLAPEQGGPAAGLWFAQLAPAAVRGTGAGRGDLVALLRLPRADWQFRESDVQRFYVSKAQDGHPEIGYEVREQRRKDFRTFTASVVSRQLAAVLDGEVYSKQLVSGSLLGVGIVSGRFSETQVGRMLELLSIQPLPVRLRALGTVSLR